MSCRGKGNCGVVIVYDGGGHRGEGKAVWSVYMMGKVIEERARL
jgi:hypothetical protein